MARTFIFVFKSCYDVKKCVQSRLSEVPRV